MPKPRPPYSPEFRRQMVDLVRAGRDPAELALAARFEQFYAIVIGTTCGMMLANIPAVLIGHRLADRLPVRVIRIAAAVVFATLAC
jgi:putative Ca2+/H+ antiporter (TMEM165/GDT1 family)